MGTEVAIVGQPVVPVFAFNEVERIATAIARGGLFGSKDPYAVLTLCMLAQAEGQHPAVVFRDYDLIQGKPAKKAEAMLRDFIGSGGKVVWNRLDDECADATFSHPQGGTVTINWTMARAQKAQLGGKDMWKKYPRQMLRSRTISEGVRTIYPGATSGLCVPEEVRDFDSKGPTSDTPATPEPKRARDLKAEEPKHIGKNAAARAKAEDWLSWLRDAVDEAGGEVEPVRTIFAGAAATLAKMKTEYPDLYAEAMQLAPTPSAEGNAPASAGTQASSAAPASTENGATTSASGPTATTDASPSDEPHPAQAIADKIIAEINDPATNAVMDVAGILTRNDLDIAAMPDELAVKIEIAADKKRAAIREAQAKAKKEPVE